MCKISRPLLTSTKVLLSTISMPCGDGTAVRSQAPAPKQVAGGGGSGGTRRKGLTSWADSDTESDVDRAPPPEKKVDAFGEEESDSDSEEEEEEGSEVGEVLIRGILFLSSIPCVPLLVYMLGYVGNR